MRSIVPIVLIAAALCLVPHRSAQAQDSPQDGPALPGARAVIRAADYPSLQAALDTVPEEGGLVRLPPGTFEIDKPLVVKTGDTAIVGAGAATHIHNTNTEGEPALILRHPDYTDSRDTELWRIRLARFRLTGNEQSGHGIVARRINEVLIDGLTVSEHGGDGVRLDHCYEDPRISDSLFTYNKRNGVNLIGCHDIVVAANQFEENRDALRCADGFNLTMTGNNLDDHLRHGVVIENTYGSVVSGNMIEECRGTAIILDRDCYGITLSSNVIAHEFGGGIDLRDAHGCAISANTFPLVHNYAVAVRSGSGRITITGNNFSDSTIGRGETKRSGGNQNEEDKNAAAGILLEGVRDITITGNTFAGLATEALMLAGESKPRRVLFAGNTLVDTAGGHEQFGPDSLATGNIESE